MGLVPLGMRNRKNPYSVCRLRCGIRSVRHTDEAPGARGTPGGQVGDKRNRGCPESYRSAHRVYKQEDRLAFLQLHTVGQGKVEYNVGPQNHFSNVGYLTDGR